MVNLTFGEQVKIILGRKGMTIKELAEQMEAYTGKPMSRQNMTQRLHRDNFQEQDMRLIAKILGCQFELSIMEAAEEVEKIGNPVVKAQVEEEPVAEVVVAVEEPVVETVEIEVPAEPEEDTNAREITVEELIDFTEPEPEVEEKQVPSFAAVKERDEERNILRKGIKGYFKKHEPVENVKKTEETVVIGDINPYTGKEYQSNSVRMHPKRIGYVQVYDQEQHKWTDMTEWAFLGYQERKKLLLGKDYVPPIYLD